MGREAVAQVCLLLGGIALVAWNPVMLVPGLMWILPIIIGIELGLSRDRTGWMWGCFLSWLGVLILACMRPIHSS